MESCGRRKAVKTIASGITALAAFHTLPVKWSKPIIEQIFIPAHAQTSGDGGISNNDGDGGAGGTGDTTLGGGGASGPGGTGTNGRDGTSGSDGSVTITFL